MDGIDFYFCTFVYCGSVGCGLGVMLLFPIRVGSPYATQGSELTNFHAQVPIQHKHSKLLPNSWGHFDTEIGHV